MRQRLGWVLVVGAAVVLLLMAARHMGAGRSRALALTPVPAGVRVGAQLSREDILAAMRRVQWIVPKVLEQTDPNYLLVMHSSSGTDELLIDLMGDKTALERLKEHPHYASVGALADCLLGDRHYQAMKRMGVDVWYESNLEAIRVGDAGVMKELKGRYWQAVLSDRGVMRAARGRERVEQE